MIEYLSGIFILTGSLLILISAIGILKMPDLFTRMSATTKASTLGVSLTLIGVSLTWLDISTFTKSITIIIFLFLTAPVAAHAICRAGYFDKVKLWEKTLVNGLKDKYDENTHKLN